MLFTPNKHVSFPQIPILEIKSKFVISSKFPMEAGLKSTRGQGNFIACEMPVQTHISSSSTNQDLITRYGQGEL